MSRYITCGKGWWKCGSSLIMVMECSPQKHSWQEYAAILFGQSNNVTKTEGDSDSKCCQRKKEGCFSKVVWLFLWMTKLLLRSQKWRPIKVIVLDFVLC